MEKTSSSTLCSGGRVFLSSIILPDLRFTSSIYPSCISVTSAQSQFVVGLCCTLTSSTNETSHHDWCVCMQRADLQTISAADSGNVCFPLKCAAAKTFPAWSIHFKTVLILEFWDMTSHRTAKTTCSESGLL